MSVMNEPSLVSPSPRTLAEAIARDLRRRILTRELPEDAAIDAALWARFYGVARTPVLEALERLRAEGLLYTRPDGRTGIAAMPPEAWAATAALRELMRVRAPLATADRAAMQALHQDLLALMQRGLGWRAEMPRSARETPADLERD